MYTYIYTYIMAMSMSMPTSMSTSMSMSMSHGSAMHVFVTDTGSVAVSLTLGARKMLEI